MNTRRFARFAVLALALAAAGCTDDADPTTTSTEAIGAEGGTVATEGATLSVPAGALADPVEIVVTATGEQRADAISPIYRFEPEGITFASPVSVALEFDPGALGEGETAVVYWTNATDSTVFETVPTTVDGNVATAQVTHFSLGFVGAGATAAGCNTDDQCQPGEVCGANGNCVPGCPTDETDCAGTCVDLATDDANCGTCGAACAEGQVCEAGSCTTPPCTSDADCATGETCIEGACAAAPTCAAPEVLCDNFATPQCVDITSDPSACGACDTPCTGEGTFCVDGVCSATPECTSAAECEAAEICDNGVCVVDPNACMSDADCATGQTCNAGVCEGTETCVAPEVDCNGTCADLNTSSSNCGSCGNSCDEGAPCVDGVCQSLCFDDSECFPGQFCSAAGVCEIGCRNDSECDPQSEVCDEGQCVPAPACTVDADCAQGQFCNGLGNCEAIPTCPAGETFCGSACQDLQNGNSGSCGMCGNSCLEEAVCRAGTCVSQTLCSSDADCPAGEVCPVGAYRCEVP